MWDFLHVSNMDNRTLWLNFLMSISYPGYVEFQIYASKKSMTQSRVLLLPSPSSSNPACISVEHCAQSIGSPVLNPFLHQASDRLRASLLHATQVAFWMPTYPGRRHVDTTKCCCNEIWASLALVTIPFFRSGNSSLCAWSLSRRRMSLIRWIDGNVLVSWRKRCARGRCRKGCRQTRSLILGTAQRPLYDVDRHRTSLRIHFTRSLVVAGAYVKRRKLSRNWRRDIDGSRLIGKSAQRIVIRWCAKCSFPKPACENARTHNWIF